MTPDPKQPEEPGQTEPNIERPPADWQVPDTKEWPDPHPEEPDDLESRRCMAQEAFISRAKSSTSSS